MGATGLRSIVVVRSLRKGKVVSSILTGGYHFVLIMFSIHFKKKVTNNSLAQKPS